MTSENKVESGRKWIIILGGLHFSIRSSFLFTQNCTHSFFEHAKGREVGYQTVLDKEGLARTTMTCEHPLFSSRATASSIWSKNIDNIILWSQLPEDTGFIERSLVTEKVLPALGPEELRRGIVSNMPSTDVFKILEIVERKYLDPNSPPLKILVIGGSVAWGQGCFAPRPIKMFRCRWSNRLENLINNALGFEAIRVYNAALGGTNTEIANVMLEFQLYLDDLGPEGADVIINGYSTNEMHVLSMQQAQGEDRSLESQIFGLMQRFIRGTQTGVWSDDTKSEAYVVKKKKYKRPVIIYLDDYLGNEQHGILETMTFNGVLHRLAKYYNIAATSSADAVRSLVYSNTRENTFSPLGWYGGRNGGYKREVHPPPGGHMAMAFVLAFSMLSYVTNFCSDIAQIRNKTVSAHQKEPSCMPPYLDVNLQLHEISHKWRNACNESTFSKRNGISNLSESPLGSQKCMFSWIAGLGEITTEQSLEKTFSESKALQNIHGDWMPRKDHNKLGYSYRRSSYNDRVNASENGHPKFDLVFDPGYKEGNTMRIVLMYMKSYGPDWNGSTVRMSGFQEDADGTLHTLFQENLLGYFQKHEPEISVSLTSRFSHVSPSNGITRIRFEVIGGQQFKFTGMVIC